VPGLIRGEHVKPGATVIDVGITRMPGTGGKSVLVGDVAFDEAV
jgi:methylenetetrahydrofolate dehydrogenase (NADP+)/methenyltetrahydrofolate cyclohydrolase